MREAQREKAKENRKGPERKQRERHAEVHFSH